MESYKILSPVKIATDATVCSLDNMLLRLYGRTMKAYLNASEVARLVNVDRATVTRWIKKGVIKGVIRPAHAQNWRIPLSSAEELLKHRESR